MSWVTNKIVRTFWALSASSSSRKRRRGELVERRERLVHQQQIGIDREGARQRDALLHAARKLRRKLVPGRGESDQRQQLVRPAGARPAS